MSIGYACKLIGVNNTDTKSCLLKNVTEDALHSIINYNLAALNNIIDYNIQNNIMLFRISSDLIPFGSSDINTIKWWEYYSDVLSSLGKKIQASGMRVSLHPGQYTVLNSPNSDVVNRAILDLIYHTRILDAMNLDSSHKIILHIGGAYNNKPEAIKRFMENYSLLPLQVKNRLVIENDDKIYCIEEVLNIGLTLNIPVVFDNLHNSINPSNPSFSEGYWLQKCKKTWKAKDGKQKIHYSQQAKARKRGSHSDYINIVDFIAFYETNNGESLDIMLEVKDKNLSCIKCVNCTTPNLKAIALEKEWSRYKYNVLQHSQQSYLSIRGFLKNKTNPSAIDFYVLLENGLTSEASIGTISNALFHVWGYFKNIATPSEKASFFKLYENFKQEKTSLQTVKNFLKRLALKYYQNYLLNSYFFLNLYE